MIRRHADSLWYVYRLEDILSVKRLVPSQTRPMMLIAEEDLLDSMTPAYFAEVQFLVSVFDPGHADESLARQAIQNKAMIKRAQGLLRAARECGLRASFPERIAGSSEHRRPSSGLAQMDGSRTCE